MVDSEATVVDVAAAVSVHERVAGGKAEVQGGKAVVLDAVGKALVVLDAVARRRQMYRADAARGVPEAQHALAIMSLKGLGGPKDTVEARQLLDLAARGGCRAASARLEAIMEEEAQEAQERGDGYESGYASAERAAKAAQHQVVAAQVRERSHRSILQKGRALARHTLQREAELQQQETDALRARLHEVQMEARQRKQQQQSEAAARAREWGVRSEQLGARCSLLLAEWQRRQAAAEAAEAARTEAVEAAAAEVHSQLMNVEEEKTAEAAQSAPEGAALAAVEAERREELMRMARASWEVSMEWADVLAENEAQGEAEAQGKADGGDGGDGGVEEKRRRIVGGSSHRSSSSEGDNQTERIRALVRPTRTAEPRLTAKALAELARANSQMDSWLKANTSRQAIPRLSSPPNLGVGFGCSSSSANALVP